MEKYLPTGNEHISLPMINEKDGAIEALGFLYMAQKGMIQLTGDDEMPLMRPFVFVNGEKKELTEISWKRENFWIPVMTAKAGGVSLKATYLAPIGRRSFAVRLTVSSPAGSSVKLGLEGRWAHSVHLINEEKEIRGEKTCFESHWNGGIVFEQICSFPLFSFAPISGDGMDQSFEINGEKIDFRLSFDCELKAGAEETVTICWGLGFEETSAATSALELVRLTWDRIYSETNAWLSARVAKMPTEKLTKVYNTNLFFCMFFSTGLTLDTEELVCVTSRSPRYYVSAAYWDRDTLLWSFPAILDADRKLARKVLEYIFTRQRRNLGIHSCYIDGTMLEPGFELDELMAPVIALGSYVEKTGDRELLSRQFVIDGIDEIVEKLENVKSDRAELFGSFLQPSDDMQMYPYLTYDNMLVWLAMRNIAVMFPGKYGDFAERAEKVREAIYEHCTAVDVAGKKYFAWSVDLNGGTEVYDEPPGSLQLLNYYGFCEKDDEIWLNTVEKIRSPEYKYSFFDQPIAEIGCAHAPYPWILSICNSLVAGHEEQAWKELELIEMDNGIACESVDPVDGTSRTGEAFATAAGFLAHTMRVTNEKTELTEELK